MSLIEAPGRRQPTPQDGARRIKHTLYNTVVQMEQGLAQVRQVIEKHGKQEIAAALGSEAAELQQVYRALKTTVEQLDNTRQVPDL